MLVVYTNSITNIKRVGRIKRIGFEPMTFRSQSEHATAASSPEYHIAPFSNKQLTIHLSKNYILCTNNSHYVGQHNMRFSHKIKTL